MGFHRQYSKSDLDLIELGMQAQARRSFWAFRQYMNPKMIKGWWQREVAGELQQFADDLIAGLRPKLLIQAPPQHGKSVQIVDFIAWLAGHDPSVKTIYTSFSERLGVRANLSLQRMLDGRKYQATFPETKISLRGAIASDAIRNRELLEYIGNDGFFRNTTVRGPVTGEGLDLGVLDDPIKGREESNSQTVRDKTYDWLTDDFMSRMSDGAGLLGIMTRWHLDDPFGRLIEAGGIKVLRYPAIAEKDEPHRKQGEPLFPEHKSLDFLMERKAAMYSANWEALYQQNPTIVGGGLFRDDWWEYWTQLPPLEWRTIYADTAQKTKEHNDFSVFQCWGRSKFGQAVLIDQMRGKWEAPELKVQARALWTKHKAINSGGALRAFKVEDKVSGTGLIQELKREGIPMIPIQRNTDKVTRAMDAAPFIESGNVLLPKEAPWLSDFLGEHSAFPSGAHDDQVDPTMDAIQNMLIETSGFIFA